MNIAIVSGFLPKDSAVAYSPSGKRVLLFDVIVCGDGDEVPWRCEIVEAALINELERRLMAGRGVVLKARLRAKPFMDAGRQKGWTRFLEVVSVEVVRAETAQTERPAA